MSVRVCNFVKERSCNAKDEWLTPPALIAACSLRGKFFPLSP